MLGLCCCTCFCLNVANGGYSRGVVQGLLANCGAWASHCSGFSYCGAQALGHAGFSSCSSWPLEHRLRSCGAQA